MNFFLFSQKSKIRILTHIVIDPPFVHLNISLIWEKKGCGRSEIELRLSDRGWVRVRTRQNIIPMFRLHIHWAIKCIKIRGINHRIPGFHWLICDGGLHRRRWSSVWFVCLKQTNKIVCLHESNANRPGSSRSILSSLALWKRLWNSSFYKLICPLVCLLPLWGKFGHANLSQNT